MHDNDPLLETHVPERDREVRFLLDSGRPDEADAVFDAAIAAEPERLDVEWNRTVVFAHRAILAWRLGRVALAMELAADTWAELDLEQARGAAAAHAVSMLGYLLDGHSSAALDLLAGAVQMARKAEAPETVAHCLLREATAYAHRALTDDPADALTNLSAALPRFDEVLALAPRDAAVHRRALAASSGVLLGFGDLDVAEQRARTALERGKAANDVFCASIAGWSLARVRRAQGRPREARDLAEQASAHAEQIQDMLLAEQFSHDLADICAESGDTAGEVAALRRAIGASRATVRTLNAGLGQAMEQRRIAVHAHQKAHAAEYSATRDPLTGLCNRLGLERHGPTLLDRMTVRGGKPWLLLVDVDRFKELNDGYGHTVGDRALCEIARLISAECRAEDLVCRWAGDEFVVLLLDTSGNASQAGHRIAERIRIAVDQHDWPRALDSASPDVTISIGAAAGVNTLASLFALADRALYRAKQAGRNGTATATNPLVY